MAGTLETLTMFEKDCLNEYHIKVVSKMMPGFSLEAEKAKFFRIADFLQANIL